MEITMSKENTARISIPGKVYDLLWNDEEFYSFLSQNKKALTSNKFPRYDQWCGEDGLHMAFALAGYSSSDIKISTNNNEITVSSFVDKQESDGEIEVARTPDDLPDLVERRPMPSVSYGVIVRGIARRNFKTKFVLNRMFDTSMATATMKNGLLEIVVPKRIEQETTRNIEIKEN